MRAHAPLKARWRTVPGLVQHTFTHFHLELAVLRAEVDADAMPSPACEPERCRWLAPRDLPRAALPSVMRKVLAHARDADKHRTSPRRGEVAPQARVRGVESESR
jgi:A/G-specific adenine glycosylase